MRIGLILWMTFAAVAVAADVREGLYEISVRSEVGGMPLSEAPMVVRQCVSQQSMQQLMSQMGGAGACNVSNFQQSGNQAHFNLTCSGAINVSGTGEAQFAGEQFTGRMDLSVQMGGDQAMPMVQKFSGKRVGECQ